jgi:glutamyl-tRNA reductase
MVPILGRGEVLATSRPGELSPFPWKPDLGSKVASPAPGMIFVGLSHQTAPVDVREQLARADHDKVTLLHRISALDGVDQAFLLGTCNRVEVYAVPCKGHNPLTIIHAVRNLLVEEGGESVAPYLASLEGSDAVKHLFRVASSLASLVVGEPQILGQLKRAVQQAEEQGTLGRELRDVTNQAFQVAKRARTETEIGVGQASVPSAAVRLARQIFGELEGRRVVLVGAGDMAQAAAKVLARAGARLTIVNRSRDRALRLQAHVGGEIASWDQLESCLVATDIVLSSTACPAIILTRPMLERVRRARRGKSLFLIDIAVPRDVDPSVNDLDGVYVYDVDDLSRIVEEHREVREQAARQVESLVAEELERWSDRQCALDVTPLIRELRDRTRQILEAEMERTLRGKLRDLSEKDRAALQGMIQSATNKLLHEPTTRLKAMAGEPEGRDHASSVCVLFGLTPLESTAGEPAMDRSEPAVGLRETARSNGGWLPLGLEFARAQ